MKVTFGPFEGDREFKTSDVFADGLCVGFIEKTWGQEFESRASMKRVWKFSHVELVLFDREAEYIWHSPKWDAVTGAKAAREKARKLWSSP